MEVTFINPGVDYMIQSIMHFQTEGEAEFWSEPLYHFYPQLDKAYAISLPVAERKDYIERTMRAAYAELEDTISEKVTLFINSLWNKHGGGVPNRREGNLIFSSLERLQSADYSCFIRGFQHRLHRLV